MTWHVDPTDFGADVFVRFEQGGSGKNDDGVYQFPWMKLNIGAAKPVVKAGCCMAFTVFFFDWYRVHHGDKLQGYFQWIQTPKGISSVMNLQTAYLGWETAGFGAPLKDTTNELTKALNAWRRKVEDKTYAEFGFESVHSPQLPSLVGSLAEEVLRDYHTHGCVYKPLYLSNLSASHAIGAILDYTNSAFLLFDANHGLARFLNQAHLQQWLVEQAPHYQQEWGKISAFFVDTKKANAQWVRPARLTDLY